MSYADFINEDLRLAVKRGAWWMDQEHPGWAQKINLNELSMNSCTRCIVGQTVGHYFKLFNEGNRDDDWAASLGFMSNTYSDYSDLETLWTEEVERRTSKEDIR